MTVAAFSRGRSWFRSYPFAWFSALASIPAQSFQIASYRLDHLFVVIQKIGDGLQERLQRDALLEQLPIGETDVGFRSSGHCSVHLFGACLCYPNV